MSPGGSKVATSPTTTIEGFSLSHAAILDGTTPGTEIADIYGIREGTLDVSTDSFDNTGDDTVLSTWNWINYATVTITSGFIPFTLLGTLYGVTLVSSGTGAATSYSVPLWNEKAMNQPIRPMLIRVPSKDTAGTPRTFDLILYRVQFAPFTFSGPTYKDGLVISYSGRALLSSIDETGTALAERAVGRMISSQAL
jgi:hypothetical protein